ncbi:hypothetical protein POM88_042866 [Heracleum sosnowskyi]|uniref:Glabrous enhancer-binding protein-like DBD domain-containing protein n=1 Tax=Heracleum sosnowskyi TaxID=360622 RepID=A0AAD8M9L2_9APIA|nr:hypothetical protein POM88_042866 [Heracleum sosnowskyi]
MAPKRQSKNLPPPSHTAEPESEPQQLTQLKPQQITQLKPQQTHQESSESDADSDSSSDRTQKPISAEPKKPVSKPQQPHQESSEADSDDDSDSSSDETQKPLSPEPKKPVPKPVSKPTEVKANGKRPAETDQIDKAKKSNKKSKGSENVEKGSGNVVSKGLKGVEKMGSKSVEKVDKGKAKVSNGEEKGIEKVGSKIVDKAKGKVNGNEEGGENEDKKVGLFARLFTEEDEIELLERMIKFKENNGGDSSFDIVAFHEFVEGFLSCTVTKNQVSDKIRRLKKKYVNYLNKGKDGEDLLISKPREFKLFEISKEIWGTEGLGSKVNTDTKVRTGRGLVGKKREIKDEVMEHTDDWWLQYPLLCASLEAEAARNFTGPLTPKQYVNKVVSRMNKNKARELEHEWEDVSVMEHQAYAKRLKVISKQAEAGMEKAEAETLALKDHLQSVTLLKLKARASHLDGALKECMRQIRNLKEEHEKKLDEAVLNKTKQCDMTNSQLETRIVAKELEIRNEEKNMSVRSTEVANKQHLERGQENSQVGGGVPMIVWSCFEEIAWSSRNG